MMNRVFLPIIMVIVVISAVVIILTILPVSGPQSKNGTQNFTGTTFQGDTNGQMVLTTIAGLYNTDSAFNITYYNKGWINTSEYIGGTYRQGNLNVTSIDFVAKDGNFTRTGFFEPLINLVNYFAELGGIKGNVSGNVRYHSFNLYNGSGTVTCANTINYTPTISLNTSQFNCMYEAHIDMSILSFFPNAGNSTKNSGILSNKTNYTFIGNQNFLGKRCALMKINGSLTTSSSQLKQYICFSYTNGLPLFSNLTVKTTGVQGVSYTETSSIASPNAAPSLSGILSMPNSIKWTILP
ncbi:MAG: hypothetical protein M1348_00645 [Candidatus Parvarchaeota archaeon]|nr:hypothetical protein [Candidatus Parvarchaeota archaeon]